MGGTADQTICMSQINHHGRKITDTAHHLFCHWPDNTLVLAQAVKCFNKGIHIRELFRIDDTGLGQVQSQQACPLGNLFRLSQQGNLTEIAAKHDFCCPENALVIAFRQQNITA